MVEVAAAGQTSCARFEDGTIRCWGAYGFLGTGKLAEVARVPAAQSEPVALGGKAIQVSASKLGDTYCAVREDGKIVCWGSNSGGLLGAVGAIGDDEPPMVMKFQGDPSFVQVDLGESHACARTAKGAVRCWGIGGRGALGTPTQITDDTKYYPPDASGDVQVGGEAIRVTAGRNHSCALLSGGALRCWGDRYNHGVPQQIFEDIGDTELPTAYPPIDAGGPVAMTSAASYAQCNVRADGVVRCWGSQPMVGVPGPYSPNYPVSWFVADTNVGAQVAKLRSGNATLCAVTPEGNLRCWGSGGYGQLGYGILTDVGDDETPASVGDVPVGAKVQDVACGTFHTCALLASGAVRCWGLNDHAQLGIDDLAGEHTSATTGVDVVF